MDGLSRNLSPSTNKVTTSSNPSFTWDNVAGVYYYQLHVSPSGLPPVWGGINIYSGTSVVYNFNGTGQNLKTGVIYYWDLRSFDTKGNYGYHYGNSLIYSTSETAPQLIDPVAQTGHYGDDKGNQSYYLIFSTRAMDPQGTDDIVSVIITGPDQKTYSLNQGSDKTYYQLWSGGTSSVPVLGPYKFRITDKSGNFSEITKQINAVLDYPRNLSPREAEVLNITTPVFKWKAVSGATKYSVRVNNELNTELWRIDNLTDTTVSYNFNNTASESLKFGFNYIVHVNAYDDEGNFGEQNNRIFYCSQSIVNPLLTANRLRSRHWAAGDLNEWWGIECSINVSDPQGLNDIDSVWLDGPDNFHMKLYDTGINGDGTAGDSRYALSTNTTGSPLTGEYIFSCRDKTGNLVTLKDTVLKVLDIPGNLNIKHNSIITDPDFLISWNSVPGATRYEVNVYSLDWSRRLWFEGRKTGLLSAIYNYDNTGTPLSEGEAYYLVIRTDDGDWGNESEINNVKFVYRSDGRHIIYVDTSNTSGVEYGTKLKPYNTLSEAIDRTVRADTVIVSPGIYQGGLENVGEITLLGKNALNTILKGGHIALQSSNTTVSGFSISESDRSGIEIYGDSNVVISNNIISDNAGHGIVTGWNGKPTKKIVIRNNTIVNNLWNGISIENDASEALIINNIISHCGSGISINTGSVVSNSFNIVFGNNNDYINLTAGLNNISKDPLYTDRQGRIYTLTVASPGLDAGNPDLDNDSKDWTVDTDDRDPDTTRMDMGAVFLDQRLLIPDTPVKLTAVSCNDLVTLKWNKVSGPYFLKYRIYCGLSSDPVTPVDSVSNSISDTSKVISGLIHGQNYYFRVAAVNRGGKTGDYSSQISAKVQTGVIPKIKSKWSGDVLICYNPGDSISKYQWYKGGSLIPGATSQYLEAKKQSGIYSIETIDRNGCKNGSIPLTVGGAQSISAWPNPASAGFTLRVTDLPEGRATISVISSAGRKVMEFQAENNNGEILREIQTSGLENGVYYIYITDSKKESYSTKLVISK
ncbi:MAG: right-handed parallel beta-helix repeat-containing protein [Bacteroidetes bacterium]|nr:right-handed parallel beta-helix repeat-containing protein [Bacteroidota bacterium]